MNFHITDPEIPSISYFLLKSAHILFDSVYLAKTLVLLAFDLEYNASPYRIQAEHDLNFNFIFLKT